MRRSERKMSEENALWLLNTAEWGVLSLTDGEEAYGVPINFVFDKDRREIYFHAAKIGRKIDFIEKGKRCAFTVVGDNRVMEKRYTTLYRSVIAEGIASVVSDAEEKRRALMEICLKFAPNETNHKSVIDKFWEEVAVIKLKVDGLSGKSNLAEE